MPPAHFAATAMWISQYRNGHDVMIHPNTGCQLADHMEWSFWVGNKWPIDLSWFRYNEPYPWPGPEVNPIAERRKQEAKKTKTAFMMNSIYGF